MTCMIVWRFAVRGIVDRRVHKFAAVLCAATGLLGWPIWTVGVLPSINGYRLGESRTVTMTLDRTDITGQSRCNRINHWARLQAGYPAGPAGSGRYHVPADVYADWSRRRPGTIRITVAPGLLGAWVVIDFERDGFTFP